MSSDDDYTPFDEVNDMLDLPDPTPSLSAVPDLMPQEGKHEVFRLYNSQGELLYITRSAQLHQLKNKDWWDQVTNIQIQRCATRGTAEDVKLVAVDREAPKYNVRTTL